ncbi:MAG: glycosyltransferase family 9 protein [Nanoarchaeota archaeon]|nr:radical SAM protein [Nanoarchaeota archaeon]
MVNLMLSYKCNKSCSFCFAKGQDRIFPKEITVSDFKKVLDWLENLDFFKDEKNRKVSILGGEPTLYSKFEDAINELKKRKIKATIFSNGLFSSKKINVFDKDVITGFVINYNPESHYTKKEWVLIHENLAELKTKGFHLKFSYNLTKNNLEHEYLIKACKKYDIKNIRFAVCCPTAKYDNDYMGFEDLKKYKNEIIGFVKSASQTGISLDLDSSIPLCVFDEKEQLFFQKNVSMPNNYCKSAIDINPDLSVYYCLALSNIKISDITKKENLREVNDFFNEKTKSLRLFHSFPECKTCKYFLRKICQGGCLGLKKKLMTPDEQKIGIKTWGGIGDGLLVTPVFKALKKQNKKLKICVVCNNNHKEIYENNPYIDRLSVLPDMSAFEGLDEEHIFETNYGKLKPSINYQKHATEIIADLLNINLKDKDISVFITKKEEEFAKKIISKYKNPIVIQITSKCCKNQEWPLKYWHKLIKSLPNHTFIQIGLENEPQIKGAVDLRGKTNIREAIAILKYSKLFVGVDSFLAHATNAVNVKGIILFGPSTEKVWGYKNNINLNKNLNCSPCIDILGAKPCPKSKKCMTKISVKEVTDSIKRILEEKKTPEKKNIAKKRLFRIF